MFLTSSKAVLQKCYENYSIDFFFLTLHYCDDENTSKIFLIRRK